MQIRHGQILLFQPRNSQPYGIQLPPADIFGPDQPDYIHIICLVLSDHEPCLSWLKMLTVFLLNQQAPSFVPVRCGGCTRPAPPPPPRSSPAGSSCPQTSGGTKQAKCDEKVSAIQCKLAPHFINETYESMVLLIVMLEFVSKGPAYMGPVVPRGERDPQLGREEVEEPCGQGCQVDNCLI